MMISGTVLSRRVASRYMRANQAALPLVDLSQPPEVVGEAIHNACTNVGFFYCTNHGVSPDLCKAVLAEARNFFDLPIEEKENISIQKLNSFRGYQSVGENVTAGQADAHEALDIFSESERAKRDGGGPTNYGKNQWPDGKITPNLRPVIEEYMEEMSVVGSKLVRGCALGLSLVDPSYFDEYFTDPFCYMRLIHYPADTSLKLMDGELRSGQGQGEHTDYGIFTMILSEDVPETLQIRANDGGWKFVDPLPGAFTCNVGDMLSRWTNGIYRSTPHRVLRTRKGGTRGRVSCPFFFEPNYDALIAPIDELVRRSGRPLSFDAIRYGDHLLEKTSSNFVFNYNSSDT